MTILLLDDDVEVGLIAKQFLSPYEVRQAFKISEARSLLTKETFQLLLIDVTLPDGSGFDFCSSVSSDPRYQHIPTIIITSLNQSSEVVFGLSCGADDYITKPFHGAVLKARVDCKLRKFKNVNYSAVRYGPFEFDTEFQRCFLNEGGESADLLLTPTEFRILLALVKSSGQLLSRQKLCDLVWNSIGAYIDPRGVNTHIAHLRKKMGKYAEHIVSIYGRGYTFQSPKQIALPGSSIASPE